MKNVFKIIYLDDFDILIKKGYNAGSALPYFTEYEVVKALGCNKVSHVNFRTREEMDNDFERPSTATMQYVLAELSCK